MRSASWRRASTRSPPAAGPDAPSSTARAARYKVLQQLALPGVPDLGTGAPDVGDGEQVQRGEMLLVAGQAREGLDDVGVGEVLLLRHRRHGQVVFDQEHDELGLVAGETVRAAEPACVGLAQHRVIAAAALGDVVEQRCDDQQPLFLEPGHQLAAERVLVRMLGHREAAQVAHHHQDVLVDGVDVEEVVLHPADDAPEGGQIAAEHRPLVHAPQFVGDAAWLLKDAQEQLAVGRVAAESAVDAHACMPQRPQRAPGDALERRVLLHRQEHPQDGRRFALVIAEGRRLRVGAPGVEQIAGDAQRQFEVAAGSWLQRPFGERRRLVVHRVDQHQPGAFLLGVLQHRHQVHVADGGVLAPQHDVAAVQQVEQVVAVAGAEVVQLRCLARPGTDVADLAGARSRTGRRTGRRGASGSPTSRRTDSGRSPQALTQSGLAAVSWRSGRAPGPRSPAPADRGGEPAAGSVAAPRRAPESGWCGSTGSRGSPGGQGRPRSWVTTPVAYGCQQAACVRAVAIAGRSERLFGHHSKHPTERSCGRFLSQSTPSHRTQRPEKWARRQKNPESAGGRRRGQNRGKIAPAAIRKRTANSASNPDFSTGTTRRGPLQIHPSSPAVDTNKRSVAWGLPVENSFDEALAGCLL